MIILRWHAADSEELLIRSIFECYGQLIFEVDGEFFANGENYMLFDSACQGIDDKDELLAELKEGRYVLESATYRGIRMEALVHRMKFMGS